jgi:hypothetical protein
MVCCHVAVSRLTVRLPGVSSIAAAAAAAALLLCTGYVH